MKFGTTKTSRVILSAKKNRASRKLGSSFQNAQPTSAKTFRRRISAACTSVGALESGFTVEPCATIKRALCSLELMRTQKPSNVQRSTSNAQIGRCHRLSPNDYGNVPSRVSSARARRRFSRSTDHSAACPPERGKRVAELAGKANALHQILKSQIGPD